MSVRYRANRIVTGVRDIVTGVPAYFKSFTEAGRDARFGCGGPRVHALTSDGNLRSDGDAYDDGSWEGHRGLNGYYSNAFGVASASLIFIPAAIFAFVYFGQKKESQWISDYNALTYIRKHQDRLDDEVTEQWKEKNNRKSHRR